MTGVAEGLTIVLLAVLASMVFAEASTTYYLIKWSRLESIAFWEANLVRLETCLIGQRQPRP